MSAFWDQVEKASAEVRSWPKWRTEQYMTRCATHGLARKDYCPECNGQKRPVATFGYSEKLDQYRVTVTIEDIDPRNPSGEGNKILNARAKADAEAKFCQR